ncbi:MAG: hypothetical protein LC808_18300 [Actinobacteria bacterium]|nr:hypothetical protein [Actinomycetota bacterium]
MPPEDAPRSASSPSPAVDAVEDRGVHNHRSVLLQNGHELACEHLDLAAFEIDDLTHVPPLVTIS